MGESVGAGDWVWTGEKPRAPLCAQRAGERGSGARRRLAEDRKERPAARRSELGAETRKWARGAGRTVLSIPARASRRRTRANLITG